MTTALYQGETWTVLDVSLAGKALIWKAGRRERWVNAEDLR